MHRSALSERSESKGFTLIEILVVIGIIVGIVALLLPQLGSFNKSQSLQNAASGFQSAIRQTQINATSGVKCNATERAKQWHISAVSGSGSYTIQSTCSTGSLGTPVTYNLPSGITFSRIRLFNAGDTDDTACSSTTATVIYSNILQETSFEGDMGCPVNFTTKVKFTLSSSSGNTSVTAEKGGSIYTGP